MFIPLDLQILKEIKYDDVTWGQEVDLKSLKKELFFKYKEIEAPKGQPNNQEGLMWIKFLECKKKEDVMDSKEWDKLKGKTLALVEIDANFVFWHVLGLLGD